MDILGKVINGYTFSAFINKGGFGSVYKAEKDGVFFAIKVFNEDYVLREFRKNPNGNNRLNREIEIMRSVNHSRLVKYVDDFQIEDETGKKIFLVMEFIEGEDLRNVLNQIDFFSAEEGLLIFKQILEGVQALHTFNGEAENTGIIHRDLKPENILLTSSGEVKIVDFGIAKVIDFTSLTSTGEIFGTGPYMSPEQITDSKHIDKRSDLYTAGVIFYEILTGEHPFDYQNQPELIDKIKNVPPVPPRKRNSTISNSIENIILKLLEKDPYRRYSNVSEITKALDDSTFESETRHQAELSPTFLLRLYNERSVLKEFTEKRPDFGFVEFPANLENVNSCKGLLADIQANPNLQVIIDPATVRLAYDAYKDTQGVKDLPYAPKDYSIITPEYLKDYSAQKEYVKQVLEKEAALQADILLTPFHYIHNSSVVYGPQRNPIEEWFDLDCKLAKESIDYRNQYYPEKKIYMGVCIKAASLQDERTKKFFLNTLSSLDVDGYLIYADGIEEKTSDITLYHYIDFLIELQRYSFKPVIAGRIPIGLGIGLLSFGISGFTAGTARFESFYEELYSESSPAYNMYVRYYFPELLTSVSILRKTPTRLAEIVDTIGQCQCSYCIDKDILDLSKDKNANLHFLESVYNQVEAIRSRGTNENTEAFLAKLDTASEHFANLGRVFKPDQSAFIRKWKEVFSSIKEQKYV